MIELFEQDIRTNDRQSSQGNQLKWENEGMWYKADYAGYEGLAEYMISHLLEQSSLSPSEYALYNLEQIKYKSSIYCGVKSRSFLQKDWQIITLERLFKNFSGESLYKSTYKIGSHEERMIFLVEQVERITGLTEFGKYLNKLFTIDALFLNEDRHMHNIAVLMNGKGEFAYCPIFDNGAGLLSDTTMDYPMNDDIYQLMDNVQSKTICSDFDEQLNISEALYGENIRFMFSEKDVQRLLEKADIYPEQQKNRVETIIRTQIRKYRYLFSVDREKGL